MPGILENRIALITGASRGIGAAVARAYASEGAHVILLARTVGALEEIDDEIQKEGKGKATLVPIDLLDFNKIDQLALSIAERFGRLDVLVGNAAMLGGLRPVTHVTNKIWDQVMGLNLTANWRLIRAFDQLLRKSASASVIFVTSGMAKTPMPFWGTYAISKSALESMANIYAAENEKSNVKVNLVDPDVVATDMRAEAMPGEDPSGLTKPEEITDIFVKLARSDYKGSGKRIAA